VIKWFKNKRYEDRIFLSGGHKDVFLKRCAIAKSEHYVRWIDTLKQAINNNDKPEIERRRKYLSQEGLRAPKTISQCSQLIKDLRTWREI